MNLIFTEENQVDQSEISEQKLFVNYNDVFFHHQCNWVLHKKATSEYEISKAEAKHSCLSESSSD